MITIKLVIIIKFINIVNKDFQTIEDGNCEDHHLMYPRL